MSLDAVLRYLIRTLVRNLIIFCSKSHFLRRELHVSSFQQHKLYRWRKTGLSTKDSVVKRIISRRQSNLYSLHQKADYATCNDVSLSTYG